MYPNFTPFLVQKNEQKQKYTYHAPHQQCYRRDTGVDVSNKHGRRLLTIYVYRHHVVTWSQGRLVLSPHPILPPSTRPIPISHRALFGLFFCFVSPPRSGMTPAEVLVRFLAFFGRQFDASRVGISVGRGALNNPFALSPSVDPRTGMPVMDAHVVIEDPLDRDQNVARSCFGFPQVRKEHGRGGGKRRGESGLV